MNAAIPGADNAGTPVHYTDQVHDEAEKYRRLAVEAKEAAARSYGTKLAFWIVF